MTVVLICDRCQRQRVIFDNLMPPGWLRPAWTWPGDEEDVCPGCVMVGEAQALRVEVER